jgi:secreted trypsin-like serine protease
LQTCCKTITNFQFHSSTVAPNSIPFQAAAVKTTDRGTTTFCGASLISARGVLTVAHCLEAATSAQIILGAHEFTHIEPTQQRFNVPSANFRLHPNYNPSNLNNDIAIILLPGQGATLNSFVQPVALPAIGVTDSFAGQVATVSGWGEFSFDSAQGSSFLRSADNNIITNDVCRASLPASMIHAGTICISTSGNRGPCGSKFEVLS